MMSRVFLCPMVAAIALLGMSSRCFAQFQVCNQTSKDDIYVAVGLFQNGGWQSTGWYDITRKDCTVVVETMNDRYYYLYVESGNTVWDGTGAKGGSNFCVHPNDAFTLKVAAMSDGGDNPICEKHGYATKRFFRVDTEKYDDYTFNIGD